MVRIDITPRLRVEYGGDIVVVTVGGSGRGDPEADEVLRCTDAAALHEAMARALLAMEPMPVASGERE